MRTRLGLLAIATALMLTACGGNATDATTDAAATTETTAAAVATAEWDIALDMGNGVSVKVTAPATFTPGSFASNYLPGQTADLFNVEVTNSGSGAFDLSAISLAPTSGEAFCSDVLDGDNGINGAPTEPLAAGATVSFKYGIACDAKVGDPLTLGLTVGDKSVNFVGTLA